MTAACRTLFFLVLFAGCTSTTETMRGTQRIIFFGDSITQLGEHPGGYVALIRDSLLRGTAMEGSAVLNAGISGNKVTDLQRRLSTDVLDKRPTLVVIYVGINDVWHSVLPGLHGTSKDTFAFVLQQIVQSIRAIGARVVLCTPSVIGEKNDGSNPQDRSLDDFADVSRVMASELAIPLCDLRASFLSYERQHNGENAEKGILTTDRVHLNGKGNALVATEIMRTITAMH